ncbi:peptidoglycan glycosyltransferase [Hymenobacter gummosus]|uniref:Peptidoglycan glycosyltransferase n=1 Tax=Hymenobacter gummosus TaxID=1776032 RepID=A0A431U0R0_9BACT|nr:penicillin-binding transpeptidase domain-containing protein [Hymenobacter gummosus]RTQ48500.1 peptidoglycan glycosyltransferase [Hymenobacter gummosus]
MLFLRQRLHRYLTGLGGLLAGGLAACSGPADNPVAALVLPEQFTPKREVTPAPQRGHILDRNGKLLVGTWRHFTLTLPRRTPLDSAALNRLLGWPKGALQARVRAARQPGQAVVLPLTAPEADTLTLHQCDWPRLVVRQYRARTYTTSVASQVLGYPTAAAGPFLQQAQRLERGRFYRLRNGGVESYYNALLSGRRGYYHPLLDSLGRRRGSWATDTTYRPGQDLHLSLDVQLQAYAERLLGERRGYIVALEPATGEILCYVSAPTYAPALLTAPGTAAAAARRELLQHPDKPLLNRPALQANPPGSVFKLVNAAVALQLGAIHADTSFRCDQSLMRCVHRHPQARNLTMALKYSCNPYFYQVLRALTEPRPDSAATAADTCAVRSAHLANWRRHLRSFGLAAELGVDAGRERPGFLPAPGYYNKVYGACRWTYPTVASLSIGQGEINLTGLQLANTLAIVANRGWYRTPHFVRGIGQGGPLARFTERHHTLVDSVHFEALVPGMVAAMRRGGTAELASLSDVGITVAGKTGTVENDEGDDHATFAGFAPAYQPKIVVAVYIENAGFGGLSAAPCAALIMEKYLRGNIAPKRRRWENWLRCGDLAAQGH